MIPLQNIYPCQLLPKAKQIPYGNFLDREMRLVVFCEQAICILFQWDLLLRVLIDELDISDTIIHLDASDTPEKRGYRHATRNR